MTGRGADARPSFAARGVQREGDRHEDRSHWRAVIGALVGAAGTGGSVSTGEGEDLCASSRDTILRPGSGRLLDCAGPESVDVSSPSFARPSEARREG